MASNDIYGIGSALMRALGYYVGEKKQNKQDDLRNALSQQRFDLQKRGAEDANKRFMLQNLAQSGVTPQQNFNYKYPTMEALQGAPPGEVSQFGGKGLFDMIFPQPEKPASTLDSLKLEEQQLKNEKLRKELAGDGTGLNKLYEDFIKKRLGQTRKTETMESSVTQPIGIPEATASADSLMDAMGYGSPSLERNQANNSQYFMSGNIKKKQSGTPEFNTYDEFMAWFNQNKPNLPQPDSTLAKAKAAFGVQ